MKFNYDIKKYDFNKLVCNILEVDNLTNIHSIFYDDGFKRKNYLQKLGKSLQSTIFHKKFYENSKKFSILYNKFIEEVICPLYDEDILYQSIPTFRIQAPKSVSVIGLNHNKNSKEIGIEGLHRDKDYNHSDKEMNYFLPFVDTDKYNTIWAESKPDKADYSPFLLKYGEIKKWSGATLMHGNIINKSKRTRVSVDFRVIPLSDFKDNEVSTLTQKIPFKIGGYWSTI